MNRIEGLDALRGYAALVVLMGHVGGRLGIPYIHGGYLAVDLFFVISGYVIAYAYDERIESLGFFGFCRVRLIRFYPLYLVGTLLGLALYLVFFYFGRNTPFTLPQLALAAFLPNLFFAPFVHPVFGEELFLDVPAWSLMFELVINFAYALFFPWLGRGVLLGIISFSGAALVFFAHHYSGFLAESASQTLLVGLARVGFSFPLGLLLYRERAWLPKFAGGGALGPAALMAMVVLFWPPHSAWRDLLCVLFVAPLLAFIASNTKPAMPRIGAFLGTISYCLYIIHEPLLGLVTAASIRFSVNLSVLTIISIIGLLAGSWALDRYYDRPARKWLAAHIPAPNARPISRIVPSLAGDVKPCDRQARN